MWIILRLLFAAGITFWRAHSGLTPDEDSTAQVTGQHPWRLRQTRNKGRVTSTTFGLPLAHPMHFVLTPESGADRLAKLLGFSREIQSDDPDFDRAVYVACDHPLMPDVLRVSPALRGAVRRLQDTGKVTRIFLDGRHLWARRGGDTPPTADELAALETIRSDLADLSVENVSALRDPFFAKRSSPRASSGARRFMRSPHCCRP
jgi:hypothetical protein